MTSCCLPSLKPRSRAQGEARDELNRCDQHIHSSEYGKSKCAVTWERDEEDEEEEENQEDKAQ